MNKNIPIGFRAAFIKTEQFAIFPQNYSTDKELFYTADIGFSTFDENKVISVLFTFQYLQDNNPFIILSVSCHFQINPDQWTEAVINVKKKKTIPRDFALHLATITVGTARGVLHSRTESTNYNGFVLPPINLTQIITADVIPV
jgi:hypothetical protein